jgi:hypothetical protein
VATGGIERITQYVGSMAQMNPAVMDKFDMDQAVDEYANAILAPPKIIRSDEDVAAKRAQDAAAMQQQQQGEQLNQLADTANKAGDILPDEMKNKIGDAMTDANS